MGIDISNAFLVGQWAHAFPDNEEGENVAYELTDNGKLYSASPYYDAGREECFYGLSVGKDAQDVHSTCLSLIDTWTKWKEMFPDIEPIVYAGKHVW